MVAVDDTVTRVTLNVAITNDGVKNRTQSSVEETLGPALTKLQKQIGTRGSGGEAEAVSLVLMAWSFELNGWSLVVFIDCRYALVTGNWRVCRATPFDSSPEGVGGSCGVG